MILEVLQEILYRDVSEREASEWEGGGGQEDGREEVRRMGGRGRSRVI